MKQGKFIVIDGADGAGKATQSALLIEKLKKFRIITSYFDFPRYDKFFGKNVAAFLRGEYGSLESVSPYLASLPYALDRMAAGEAIRRALEAGSTVIANRYVSSNMAHQAAKFTNKKESEEFIEWLINLEYKELRIPREDIVVYLYLPESISSKLVSNKTDRSHLKGKKKDIHENSGTYQKSVINTYLDLAKKNDWIVIDCIKKGKLMSTPEINGMIVSALQKRKFLPNQLV